MQDAYNVLGVGVNCSVKVSTINVKSSIMDYLLTLLLSLYLCFLWDVTTAVFHLLLVACYPSSSFHIKLLYGNNGMAYVAAD